MSKTYCEIAPTHPVHGHYHNKEYGFPVHDEQVLFERLALEIMQAGLSWEIVLKKRVALNDAFDRFNVDAVAAYDEADIARLLANAGIIRNRLKILAIIKNAQKLQEMRASYGGFLGWLDAHYPLPKNDWIRLFKREFSFTGGEIVGEFLMSIGYLPGAHVPECPIYREVLQHKPAWQSIQK